MRRIILALALCCLSAAALASSAYAAGTGSARHQAHIAGTKAPKPTYEYCGSFSGCGWGIKLFSKTKTFEEIVGGSITLHGSYATEKGLLQMYFENGCYFYLYKIPHTANYYGEEPAGPEGCFVQTIELIHL